MAFIPAANTVELVIQQELAGQVVDNVLNFLYPAPVSTIDLATLAGAAITDWILDMAPVFVEALTLIGAKATDLTTASSATISVAAPGDSTGNVVDAPTSNNVALVLSQRTDSRGRSFRGRSYSAGLPSEQRTDASTMSVEYVTDFLDAWTQYIDDLADIGSSTHVVVSRFANNVARTNAVMTPVTGYSVNRELDSQRRRLSGRGI